VDDAASEAKAAVVRCAAPARDGDEVSRFEESAFLADSADRGNGSRANRPFSGVNK
jgi:hypothetical protein